jgi:hypothetical protein
MQKSSISAAIRRYEAKAPVVIPFCDAADVSHVGLWFTPESSPAKAAST